MRANPALILLLQLLQVLSILNLLFSRLCGLFQPDLIIMLILLILISIQEAKFALYDQVLLFNDLLINDLFYVAFLLL